MVALFVVATIIVFFVIDYFVQRAEKRKAASAAVSQTASKPRFIIPKGYFFGKGHTWVELLPTGSTRIGLDDFVQKIVGAIDEIKPAAAGNSVAKGEKLFSIRQGNKSLSFESPLSGKVVSFNDNVVNFPDVARKEPYKGGWVAVVEPTDLSSELKQLSIGNEAAQWLREEIKRFRNFITAQRLSLSGSPATAGATLMDGGVPVDSVMEQSTQEVWQKFEKEFLGSAGSGKSSNL